MTTACVQAVALSSLSNIAAQLLDRYNNSLPLGIDPTQLLRFSTMSCISCPPNFLWQDWLEKTWPGRKGTVVIAASSGKGIDIEKGGHGAEQEKLEREEKEMHEGDGGKGAINWKNTCIKSFVDCITLGAIWNTLLFLIMLGVLKGRGFEEVLASLCNVRRDRPKIKFRRVNAFQDTIPLIVAGYKFWPFVNFLTLALVPVEKRIVVFSAAGLIWGVFLSLFAAKK
ncbi:hypothetical protein LTS18_009127 [Coniosporium uncinatum]|uniref:Uncharacterized protein n=1 Tax=Coniosporium uncinatum TaxID=93489 RepID=A0ACC3DAD6_9PEZI|nr:hypothetical protein LTS18_009127 [Coniosporium uncinatum]